MTSAAPAPPPQQPGPARSRRGRKLPRVTMEVPAERRRGGVLLAVALHVVLIFLITYDYLPEGRSHIDRILLGAGGPGPAGGGGGGNGGTGGMGGGRAETPEHLAYIRVATPPPPPAQAAATAVTPPQPTIAPPPITPPVTTTPVPATTTPVPAPVTGATGSGVAGVPGSGGGTGTGGGTGSGPGSGGGVGSGIGTGRGSGTGPGTGGGTQANYPPTPTEMFLPPLPVPAKAKGFHVIAEFDVDEHGNVLDMTFTETRDGGYNRKLRDVLKAIRFRPGTTPAGVPLRMKTQVEFTLY